MNSAQSEQTHVVIVNYCSVDLLKDCLLSLRSEPVATITVLDNGSGASETKRLHALEAEDSRIRLICGEVNLGFGAGVNLAVSESGAVKGDLVWILNPDTRVRPGAAAVLADHLRSYPFQIVSPLIESGDMASPRIWFAGGTLNKQIGFSDHPGFGRLVLTAPTSPVSCTFITGAAPMMSFDSWTALGGYREDLFLYWEDADMSARAIDMGMELWMLPMARIWHKSGGSSATDRGLSNTFYYYMQRNRLLVNGPFTAKWALVFGRGFLQTVRLLAKPLLSESTGRGKKFLASASGLGDGIRGVTGPWKR